MGHSIGRISRQSSCTRPEASLSPTAELCSSDYLDAAVTSSLACQASGRYDLLASMKRRFFLRASTLAVADGRAAFSPVVQRRKREFLSIQIFTRVFHTETRRW